MDAQPLTPHSQPPAAGLGQAFLAAVVAFGKARDMGLPDGTSIQECFCGNCLRHTDHLIAANGDVSCMVCGH